MLDLMEPSGENKYPYVVMIINYTIKMNLVIKILFVILIIRNRISILIRMSDNSEPYVGILFRTALRVVFYG